MNDVSLQLEVVQYIFDAFEIAPKSRHYAPIDETVKYLKSLGVQVASRMPLYTAPGFIVFEVKDPKQVFRALDAISSKDDEDLLPPFCAGQGYVRDGIMCGTWYDNRGLRKNSPTWHVIELIAVWKRSFIVVSEQLPL